MPQESLATPGNGMRITQEVRRIFLWLGPVPHTEELVESHG
jgi:hypothetical protein